MSLVSYSARLIKWVRKEDQTGHLWSPGWLSLYLVSWSSYLQIVKTVQWHWISLLRLGVLKQDSTQFIHTPICMYFCIPTKHPFSSYCCRSSAAWFENTALSNSQTIMMISTSMYGGTSCMRMHSSNCHQRLVRQHRSASYIEHHWVFWYRLICRRTCL